MTGVEGRYIGRSDGGGKLSNTEKLTSICGGASTTVLTLAMDGSTSFSCDVEDDDPASAETEEDDPASPETEEDDPSSMAAADDGPASVAAADDGPASADEGPAMDNCA